MSLREKVLADMKEAMKSKDEVRLGAVRFLQAAIKNREIELRPNAITDQDIIQVVRKMSNQIKDAISQFEAAGRTDLADKEKGQIQFIESYLPKQMSREDLEKIIAKVMAEVNATSVKDMGAVIKGTIAATAGAADSKMISEIVKSKLS
jgi:uncharacterized protein